MSHLLLVFTTNPQHVPSLHIIVNVAALGWLLGTLVPIVTAIVTQSDWKPGAKAIANAVIATLAGLLAAAIKTSGQIDVLVWLGSVANTLIVSWATYEHFWKPTTIAPRLSKATDVHRHAA